MSIQDKKLLYHLTTLDVFPSIVQNGLLSREDLARRNLNFIDTANHDILAGRERLHLSDRIPFHFHQHTAYDTAVKSTYSNQKFIYLRLHRSYAEQNRFGILTLHPTSNLWEEELQVYSYQEGIKKIDWTVMEMTKQQASLNHISERYHRQVRMAECLSPANYIIPISDFQSIAVPDQQCEDSVHRILEEYQVKNKPYIDIQPELF